MGKISASHTIQSFSRTSNPGLQYRSSELVVRYSGGLQFLKPLDFRLTSLAQIAIKRQNSWDN
jgi:hypothetical protein